MNLIDEYIKELNEKTKQDRAGALHPSNLGKCQRATIYEYLGQETTVEHNIETLRAFLMGNLIEELVTKIHDAKGILIADQVPLGAEIDGVPIRGTLDELLKWEDGYAISDVKSVHANAFQYGKFPYHHHELQLGAYEWMLEDMIDRYAKVEADFVKRLNTMGGELLTEFLKELFKHQANPQDWKEWCWGLLASLASGKHGPRKPSIIYYLSFVSSYDLKLKKVRVSRPAKTQARLELEDLAGYINRGDIPERPFKTPKEHGWLCMKKQEGERVPSCLYYHTCWGD